MEQQTDGILVTSAHNYCSYINLSMQSRDEFYFCVTQIWNRKLTDFKLYCRITFVVVCV